MNDMPDPDILMICKDGFKQSVIANLATAVALKKKGLDVVLMFTQEALVALAEQNFPYQGLLEHYAKVIEETIGAMGFSADPLKLLNAADDMGVNIISCPIWAEVAESKNNIPPQIRIVKMDELFDLLFRAKKIMGSF